MLMTALHDKALLTATALLVSSVIRHMQQKGLLREDYG